MKVYYWEGSVWKNRELQSHAVLVKVQQAACVMPPNFIMGSPLIDFQGSDGNSDKHKQFGIVRVIDDTAFDLKVFAEVLQEIFGGDARLKLICHENDTIQTVALPARECSLFSVPDWESELDQWLTKHKPS